MPNLLVYPNEQDLRQIQEYFSKLPETFEKQTNDFMHSYGRKMERDIKKSIGVSRYHPGGRHAKLSDSLEVGELYLGFYVKTRAVRTIRNWREYGYLIFPEEGRGPHNPVAQGYFKRAKEKHEPIIFDKLKTILEKAINQK